MLPLIRAAAAMTSMDLNRFVQLKGPNSTMISSILVTITITITMSVMCIIASVSRRIINISVSIITVAMSVA